MHTIELIGNKLRGRPLLQDGVDNNRADYNAAPRRQDLCSCRDVKGAAALSRVLAVMLPWGHIWTCL